MTVKSVATDQSAANGAERFYRKEIFRNESPSLARELDEKMIKIYGKHKDHRIIDNEGASFEDKLNSVTEAIADKLNIVENRKQSPSIQSFPSDDQTSTKSRKRTLNLPSGPDVDANEDTKVQEPTNDAVIGDQDAVKETLDALRIKNKEQQLEIERLQAQLAMLNQSKSNETTESADMSNIANVDDVGIDDENGSLKVWMEEMGVFDDTLFQALMARNVKSYHLLRAFPQHEFDNILRNVRAEKLTNLKDPTKRNSIDEQLVRFEKACRSTPKKSSNGK